MGRKARPRTTQRFKYWSTALAFCLTGLMASEAFALDVEALHDEFNGDWKDCLWQGYQRYGGDTYKDDDANYDTDLNSVQGGRLDLKVPSNYLSGMNWETGLQSTYELGGDFDIQVDFFLPNSEYWSNLEVRGINLLFVELMANDAGSRRRQVRNSQINPDVTSARIYPYLWVANHSNDRVTQINTDTGQLIGQYRTGDNPSRTTVDLDGDVWINHRCDSTAWRIRPGQCAGTECTEAEVNAALTNLSPGVQGNGIRYRYDMPYSNGQCNGGGAAVDKNNDPWIGFLNDKRVIKIDRDTGATITDVSVTGKVYGLAVDVNDFIWSDEHWSGRISKIDALTGVRIDWYAPGDGLCFKPYGISLDAFGKVWNSQWGDCPYITRFDPETETFDRFSKATDASKTLYQNRGIAADNQGLIWTVSSRNHILSAWDMETGEFLGQQSTCTTPTGVALDRNNKIWVTCSNGHVQRFSRPTISAGSFVIPNAEVDIDMGYSSYSYSDMTGYQLRNFGSDAWKENFLDKKRKIGDSYFVSTIENNYGGGVEEGLGGNLANNPNLSPVQIVSTNSTYNYTLNRLTFGDHHYTDTQSRIIKHPSTLENLWGLHTPDADRLRTDNNVITLQASEDVSVFLAYDHTADSVPAWMTDYSIVSGETIEVTDAGSSKFALYKKDFLKGDTITFGGNLMDGVASTTLLGSCSAIKKLNPLAPTGNYTIDTGVSGPMEVFCDMRSDGATGHTMVRIPVTSGDDTQDYIDACTAIGMEIIVPRSKGHAYTIMNDFNGGIPPSIVNVYPKFDGAAKLSDFTGKCQGHDCAFYISDSDKAGCTSGSSSWSGFNQPSGDNTVDTPLYSWFQSSYGNRCGGFGLWNDSRSTHRHLQDAASRGWVICSTNDAPMPRAKSCGAYAARGTLQNRGVEGISGVYPLVDHRNEAYEAFCDMSFEGGGWTLAVKSNGNSSALKYTASTWLNAIPLGADKPDLDIDDAKLLSYASIPFDEMRLGFTQNFAAGTRLTSDYQWGTIAYTGESLLSVIQPDTYQATSFTRNAWKALIPGSSLQQRCNKEGFNVGKNHSRVRLGIVGNNENNCNSPDSRLGIGGQGSACGQTNGIASGNTARCGADNGNVDIRVNSALLVRQRPAKLVKQLTFDGVYSETFHTSAITPVPVSGASNVHNTVPGANPSPTATDQAVRFTNNAQYIYSDETQLNNELDTDSLTIALWVKLDSDPNVNGNNNWRSLVRKGSTAGTTTGFDVVLEQNRGITFDTGHLDGATDRFFVPGLRLPVGNWAHLALTYDHIKGVKSAYLNGVFIASRNTGPRGPIAPNNNPVYISTNSALNPSGSGWFPGAVDDVRFYDGAIDTFEISSISGTSVTATQQNYFAYFVPQVFLQPPPSPKANTIIQETAHDQLSPGGKLRIRRVGTAWFFYYVDQGSGTDFDPTRTWSTMGPLDMGTQNVTLRLRTRLDPFWHSGPANDPGGAMSIQYDDFVVNSADRVIGGPYESCDGIDNDCDGKVDEDYPGQGDMCNTGLPGICGDGALICTGPTGAHCQQLNTPQPEICDNIDNDCDGLVDENATSDDPTITIGTACTVDTALGPCRQGQYVCDGGNIVCKPVVNPTPDVCDNIDNDCDGVVDNTTDHVFSKLGFHTLAYQRSTPFVWPRPIEGASAFYTGDNATNDFVDFDGTSSSAPTHALRKARVVLYLDPTLANASNPFGQYVLWFAHGAKDATQGSATATYVVRHSGAPLGVLLSNTNQSSALDVVDGTAREQKFVLTNDDGQTGDLALGPIPASALWNLSISAHFTGDVDTWELYNADTDTTQEIITGELLSLQNKMLPNTGLLITADTGKSCAITTLHGACSQGTGQCMAGGNFICSQTVNPQPELCDGIDNNCDGVTDGPNEIVYARVEVKQEGHADISDWTWAPTINNGISSTETLNFTPHDTDDRAGSPAMPAVEDPSMSPQDHERSIVLFHRDTRVAQNSISMPLIHGKYMQGADGNVPQATSIRMRLSGYAPETFSAFYDDRVGQHSTPADQSPVAFSASNPSIDMESTLSRWMDGSGYHREADATIVMDVFEDRFIGSNDYSIEFLDAGNLSEWKLYIPFRDSIDLAKDKKLEVRTLAEQGKVACVLQEHPLPECLGQLSKYVCINGQTQCQINPSGCCQDNDGDGYDAYDPIKCDIGNDCDDTDPDINPGADEICDGIDNNCGGFLLATSGMSACSFLDAGCDTVDETFPEAGMECEDIDAGITNEGVCRAEFLCQGGTLNCVNLSGPTEELCDGLDNNCDGLIDASIGTTNCSGDLCGPQECGYQLTCSCRKDSIGPDNCFCTEGLEAPAQTTQGVCPPGEFLNGDTCQAVCARDIECTTPGNVCIQGVCQPNRKSAAGIQGGANHCSATPSSQHTHTPWSTLGVFLLGGLILRRRRARRKAARADTL